MIPRLFKNLTKKTLPTVLFISFFTFSTSFSQELKSIKGVLQDSTGLSIISATIKLTSPVDTLYTSSDVDGNFSFNTVKAGQFNILINSLGFDNFNKEYRFGNQQNTLDLGTIILKTGSHILQEVSVDGSPLIVVKEDTLE